jgi:hypothetical protein
VFKEDIFDDLLQYAASPPLVTLSVHERTVCDLPPKHGGISGGEYKLILHKSFLVLSLEVGEDFIRFPGNIVQNVHGWDKESC